MHYSTKLARYARRALLAIVAIATLTACFLVEENWRGARAWRIVAAEYAAHGDPLDVLPAPASLPPERNFMETPVLRAVLFTDAPQSEVRAFDDGLAQPLYPGRFDWRKGARLDLAKLAEAQRKRRAELGLPDLAPAATPAESVLEAMAPAEPVLGELRQSLATSPESCLVRPIAWSGDGPDAPIVRFQPIRTLATTLAAHACASLAAVRSDDALADTLVVLRLARGLFETPDACLVEPMIGRVLAHTAIQPIWEGCVNHRWTELQLAQLQAEIALLRPMPALACALRTDRALLMHRLDRMTSVELTKLAAEHRRPMRTAIGLLPAGWIQRNKLAALPAFDAAFGAIRASGTPDYLARFGEAATSHTALQESGFPPFLFVARWSTPAVDKVLSLAQGGWIEIELARTACALERLRLRHTNLPRSLEGLVPDLLDAVPLDPMDGQPLRYRPVEDGSYLLYSIGIDGKDDGGLEGDWVWPQPAK